MPKLPPENGESAGVVIEFGASIEAQQREFQRLALEKGLCSKEEEVDKLCTKFAAHPSFFFQINNILRKRSKPIRIGGNGFASSINYKYEVPLLIGYIKATEYLADDIDMFDQCWEIISEVWHGGAKDADPAVFVARALSVYSRFEELYPKGMFYRAKFFEIEVAMECSKEVKHDVGLTNGYKLHYSAKVDALKAYYAAGHKYICHKDFWGKSSVELGEAAPREEVEISEKMSLMNKYPPFQEQEKIIKGMMRTAPNLRPLLMEVMTVFCEHDIDLTYFEILVDAISNGKSAPETESSQNDAMARIMKSFVQFQQRDLVVAIMILADILSRGGTEVEEYVPYFEERRLGELEQAIYSRKLQEHAAKFPEKPLEEVKTAFMTKETVDTELPPQDVLDRAFELYSNILEQGKELITSSNAEITLKLKELCASEKNDENEATFKAGFFTLLRELFKREFGVYPYNTQLIAILMLIDGETLSCEEGKDECKGTYEQIKTGEGKSLILALTASYFAVLGKKVDLITSNPYLAQRDALRFSRFYEHSNATAGHYEHRNNGDKAMTDNPQILYTTNQDMIFGYLQCRLNNRPFFHDDRFDVALIDEADNLCIDMGEQSCRIAQEAPALYLEATLRKFLEFADTHGEAIIKDLPEAISEFKKYYPDLESTHPVYIGLYLHSAVGSTRVRENEDYIIRDEKIIIIDVHNTGRVQEKTHWGQGLHEFVTLRNSLPLQPHQGVTAQMNHPSFIKKFKRIHCISGTFGDSIDRDEIQEVYKIRGFDVPSHHTSQRIDKSSNVKLKKEEFLEALTEKVVQYHEQGRPLLVLTSSILESMEIYELLKSQGHPCQLLNDVTNCDIQGDAQKEDTIIHNAGKAGMTTIATIVAGRGADIIPTIDAVSAGGAHALLTFIPFNKRVEYQGRGRAGRQGNPGSSEILVCAETDLFLRDLPDQIKLSIVGLHRLFGAESPELQTLIELLRKCRNLAGSIMRTMNLEKDEIAASALDRYFITLATTARRLEGQNDVIREHREQGLSSFLVSQYMSDTWASEFSQLETVINHSEILETNGDEPTEIKEDSVMLKKLKIVFEQVIGMPIERFKSSGNPAFIAVIETIFSFYASNLLKMEARVLKFDPATIRQMTRGLERKVQTLAEECEGAFKTASVTNINDFIRKRQEQKKKRESENGE